MARPPVKRHHVDAGVVGERGPGGGAGAEHEVPTPAGRPASSSSSMRMIAVCGVSSLGLSTNVQPATIAGATFHAVCSSG